MPPSTSLTSSTTLLISLNIPKMPMVSLMAIHPILPAILLLLSLLATDKMNSKLRVSLKLELRRLRSHKRLRFPSTSKLDLSLRFAARRRLTPISRQLVKLKLVPKLKLEAKSRPKALRSKLKVESRLKEKPEANSTKKQRMKTQKTQKKPRMASKLLHLAATLFRTSSKQVDSEVSSDLALVSPVCSNLVLLVVSEDLAASLLAETLVAPTA